MKQRILFLLFIFLGLYSCNSTLTEDVHLQIVSTGLVFPFEGSWKLTNGPHDGWSCFGIYTSGCKIFSSLDFAIPSGGNNIDVRAMGSGMLTRMSDGCGAIINHANQIQIYYYHLLNLRANGSVNSGEIIGKYHENPQPDGKYCGETFGPHVHITIYYNGILSDIRDFEICGWQPFGEYLAGGLKKGSQTINAGNSVSCDSPQPTNGWSLSSTNLSFTGSETTKSLGIDNFGDIFSLDVSSKQLWIKSAYSRQISAFSSTQIPVDIEACPAGRDGVDQGALSLTGAGITKTVAITRTCAGSCPLALQKSTRLNCPTPSNRWEVTPGNMTISSPNTNDAVGTVKIRNKGTDTKPINITTDNARLAVNDKDWTFSPNEEHSHTVIGKCNNGGSFAAKVIVENQGGGDRTEFPVQVICGNVPLGGSQIRKTRSNNMVMDWDGSALKLWTSVAGEGNQLFTWDAHQRGDRLLHNVKNNSCLEFPDSRVQDMKANFVGCNNDDPKQQIIYDGGSYLGFVNGVHEWNIRARGDASWCLSTKGSTFDQGTEIVWQRDSCDQPQRRWAYDGLIPEARLTVSPNPIALTSGTVNGVGASAVFTLANNGGVSAFSIVSTNPLFSTNITGGSLGDGVSTFLTVMSGVCPSVGTQTGEIRISGNGSNTTLNVSRVCTLAPSWSVNTSSVVLPSGVVGDAGTFSLVTITNTGGTGTFTVSPSNSYFTSSVTTDSLAAGGAYGFYVYAGSCPSAGVQSGIMTVAGGGSSLNIDISRSCVAPSSNLLFYDPKGGVITMQHWDGSSFIPWTSYSNQRKDWHIIVPGQFGGDGNTDYLFYSRTDGLAEIYTSDSYGNLNLLKQQTYHKGWKNIVPGQFGGDGWTDLLFFDPEYLGTPAGIGQFFSTDGAGNLGIIKAHDNWIRDWKNVVPININGDLWTDLLFFAPTRATGTTSLVATTDGSGNLTNKAVQNYAPSWRSMVPGVYDSSGRQGLMVYDPAVNRMVFGVLDSGGVWATLSDQQTAIANSWRILIGGEFGDSSQTDILAYSRPAGTAMVRTIQDGNLSNVKLDTTWYAGWGAIQQRLQSGSEWQLGGNLAFASQVGQAAPAAQSISAKNIGNQPGLLSYTIDQSWLTITPSDTKHIDLNASATLGVQISACSTAGTETAKVTVGDDVTSSFTVTRVCAASGTLPAAPNTPTDLQVSVSSDGRIYVAWSETSGATHYEFKGTFDNQDVSVNGQAPTQSNSTAGAVATFLSAPDAVDKQGKPVCLAVRAVNAGGSSSYTSLGCTMYRYYTVTTLSKTGQDDKPRLTINR